jgi:hypothetical protein
MFKLNSDRVIAPVTSHVFDVPAASTTLSDYLETHRASDNTTKATIGAIIKLLADESVKAPGSTGYVKELTDACKSTFAHGADTGFNSLFTATIVTQTSSTPSVTPATARNADELIQDSVITNLPNAAPWFVNLVNAAKKMELTESNVEGFFASLGHTGTKSSVVAILINKLSPFFPDSISDKSFRDTLMKSSWTDYRVARISSGKILVNLLPYFRELGITVKDDVDETAVRFSDAEPWDFTVAAKIPDKLLAYGYIFHEAAGTPIEKWYQGKRAAEKLPAARFKGAKDIFKRYLAVKNDASIYESYTKVGEFIGAKGFF